MLSTDSFFTSSPPLFWPTAGRILNLLGLEPLDVLLEELLEGGLELSSFLLGSESFSFVEVLPLILILWFLIVPWLGRLLVLPPAELAPLNLQLYFEDKIQI